MKKVYKLSLFALFFFYLGCQLLVGQSYQFIRYAEDEGLSSTLVKSVTTDKNGFVWVATDDGLFRFDGHNFIPIHDELPSHYVKSVYCQSNGKLLATTDLGLISISSYPQSVDFKTLKMGSVKEVDSLMSFPKTIYGDSKGKVWVSDNRKIYSLNSEEKIKTYTVADKASSNNFQRSFSFAEDGWGNLLSFSEPGYVFRYDTKTDRFSEIELPESLSNIQCVASIDRGNLLVSSRGGLYELLTDNQGNCRKLTLLNSRIEVSTIIQLSKGHFLAGTWANGLIEIKKTGSDYTFTQLNEFPEKILIICFNQKMEISG